MNSYNPFSLHGKTILVTGASSGIGRSIAVECSKMGACVILSGRNKERLEDTARLMDSDNPIILPADLNLVNEVELLVEQIPSIDGLVNNAGVSKRLLVKDLTVEAMEMVMHSNFMSGALLSRNLIKQKKLNKAASIIFISSRGADRPTTGNSIYSASKGAINSFARVMALELASKGIRVNAVLPGMVWTPLIEHSPISVDQYREDEKRYPLGRYGKPVDIAHLVVYLLSDASCWMTGSSITIDGGVSLL